jgi:hypothetical protein
MKNLLKPQNDAEAQAIKAVLAEHGITAVIRSFHDTAYDGLYQKQYGWGVIRVAEEDLDRARQIVDEWQAAAPSDLPWNKG